MRPVGLVRWRRVALAAACVASVSYCGCWRGAPCDRWSGAGSHTTGGLSSHTTGEPAGEPTGTAAEGGLDSSTFPPHAQEIQLTEADSAVYDRVLAAHRGKVVLVDFWATWCVPCQESFPKVLAYGRDYADRGLVVVSVSLDDASERRKVAAFLQKSNARIDNLISKWGAGTASSEAFKIDSALPYYKLYDRKGQLRHEFSGATQGLDHVKPLGEVETRIQELLQESAE
ncbi:MAG: TlpA family protein disulfide reductase [Planctomycetes bacterium]|nr:TlpA family protein disulfide reductase [Planctomycetota bacterium]